MHKLNYLIKVIEGKVKHTMLLLAYSLSGVGTLPKKDLPSIILWHCLNHRLELAVNDSRNAVSGSKYIQAFFSEITQYIQCLLNYRVS